MSNRSPNFPAIGLSKSIVHIKNIWAKEKRSPFPPEQAATAMGYKSINGTSLQHIGALKRYGLIESRDKDFLVLSELAIEIVAHPVESEEYQAAVNQAALNPKIFAELYGEYKDASNGTIKACLITKKGFSDDGAKRFTKSFRDTARLLVMDNTTLQPEFENDIIEAEFEDVEEANNVQTEIQKNTNLSIGSPPPYIGSRVMIEIPTSNKEKAKMSYEVIEGNFEVLELLTKIQKLVDDFADKELKKNGDS